MTAYDWAWHGGDTIPRDELYALLSLRVAVFVVEQRCAYQELDGRDLLTGTEHLIVRQGDDIAASLRLLVPSDDHEPVAIGRVVIHPGHRGSGLGHRLMEAALAHLGERWPRRETYLSAQAHLQRYYARHGFAPVTEIYLEDEIPHIGMRRPASLAAEATS